MRIVAILMIGYLLSCKSTAQINNTELEVCKKDIVIVQSDVVDKIESLLVKEDFYLEGKSQYYMYEIVLDKNLKIKDVNTVFENNSTYTEPLINLLKQLSFGKIDDSKKCDEYILPFIIQARLKKLLYPKDKTFYEVDLPIE